MFINRLLKLQIRKQRRHRLKDGTYVVYGHSVSKRQIHDISLGGLSFYYVDKGRAIDRGFRELSLVNGSRISLGNLSFRKVSDIETGEIPSHNKRVKRQSVRFEGLTSQQKKQLKTFIAKFSNDNNAASE
jgi:hypothetical protein